MAQIKEVGELIASFGREDVRPDGQEGRPRHQNLLRLRSGAKVSSGVSMPVIRITPKRFADSRGWFSET